MRSVVLLLLCLFLPWMNADEALKATHYFNLKLEDQAKLGDRLQLRVEIPELLSGITIKAFPDGTIEQLTWSGPKILIPLVLNPREGHLEKFPLDAEPDQFIQIGLSHPAKWINQGRSHFEGIEWHGFSVKQVE
ncbi:MAG: hypothetical protein JJU20_14340 [Opitutales bacterium]|nr:hypothetical protein [Opitutales bacterium]